MVYYRELLGTCKLTSASAVSMLYDSVSRRFCERSFVLLTAFVVTNCYHFGLAEEPNDAVVDTWTTLFDGRQLGRWQVVKKGDFADGGEVGVQKGNLIVGTGKPATGVRLQGDFPRVNYEIELEGKRVEGGDFFCGLTFPVDKGSLTLILGGWSGWVCGLSCIDGRYAIDNNTACGVEFKNGQWYRVRLRVTASAVQVWVDGKQIIDLKTDGHKLAASEEMQPCLPVGIATWKTTGALRNLRYRPLE